MKLTKVGGGSILSHFRLTIWNFPKLIYIFFFFSSSKPPGVQVIKLIYVFLEVSLLIFGDEKFNKETVADSLLKIS